MNPLTINININLTTKGFPMTAFTDAMTALAAALQASQKAVDPAHLAALDASVANLTAAQATLGTAETNDAANIADIQAGLKILTDSLVPAAAPAPSPAA